jgi:hypothetical protein
MCCVSYMWLKSSSSSGGTSICTTYRYSLISVVFPVVFVGLRLARAAGERQAAPQDFVVVAVT